MKYIITIEETVSENFEIEASNIINAMRLAEKKYKDCEIVLHPGNLTGKQMRGICLDTDEETEWVEF